MLLKLYDIIADEPIAHGLHAVDSLDGRRLRSIVRGLDDGSQVTKRVNSVAPILKGEFHAFMDVC